jgi:L-ascorbate metabolism protein UlaG (beta-lactamase superfamily)
MAPSCANDLVAIGAAMSQSKPPSTPTPGPAVTRRALNRSLAALPLAGCAAEPAGTAEGGPWHHVAGGGFRNPPGSPERGGDFGDWSGFFLRRLTDGEEVALPAGHVLPEAEALDGVVARRGDRDRLTWLGHASFLLRLDGVTVLTDPYLGAYASPLPPLGPKRFAPPGLPVERLPPIDLLLLSHNHYDHMDLPTIEALPGKERLEVVVPLGLAGYFRERGYQRVRELDWYQGEPVAGLGITALPAIHFSKRTLFDRNRTLWTGYAIQGRSKRVYFAGDTAYGPVFQELGQQLAPFDLGLLPIGAYEPRTLMKGSHATPEETVQIARELGIARVVGMHWGTIRLTEEPPFEPPERFRSAAAAAGYAEESAWVMRIGETREV